jgi:DNA-binding MarR family transcriptional regulator
MNTLELVYKTLKSNDNMLRPGDIAEKAGIDKKEVDKAIKQLVKEEKVFSPKRCFYACK